MKLLLGKHELALQNLPKNYGIEYLTTEVELVLPNFKSCTVHKIIEYLTLGLLLAFEISIRVQQLTFLTHPV